jgi:hypothetical protein
VKSFFVSSLFVAIQMSAFSAMADLDPSSALMLKGGGTQSQPGVNLDSGRYTIRPSAAPTPQSTKVEPKGKSVPAPVSVSGSASASPASATSGKGPATANSNGKTAPATEKTATGTETETATDIHIDSAFPERMKDFFLGGAEDEILRYRSSLHAQDSRQNFVEVSVAPGYLYQNSKSDYWYRKYYSTGPGLGVAAKFWLTPFFGVQSSYFTTFAADMTSKHDSEERVNTDHRIFNAGLQFRKYFNMTRKSPNMVLGINYDETQLLVPKTETERVRIKTTGPAFRIESTVPTTVTKAWVYSAEFLPKIKINEMRTELNLRTGKKPTAYGFKFGFGQDFNFDRNNRVFWRLSHRIDKVVYEGDANQPDPITTLTPSNVGVTQGTSLFQFGFTWGD